MFFVLRQIAVADAFKPTFREENVRLGGYRHKQSAFRAARKESMPCLVKDHARNIIGQTVTRDAPRFIA